MTRPLFSPGRVSLAAAAACLAAASGCGPKPLPSVAGRVTLDGRPLAGAYVSFLPAGRPPGDPAPVSFGRTDADGRYALRTADGGAPGALPGPHRVTVSLTAAPPGSPDADPVETLPARYNARTALSFTVPPAGAAEVDFDLVTAPPGGGR